MKSFVPADYWEELRSGGFFFFFGERLGMVGAGFGCLALIGAAPLSDKVKFETNYVVA